MIDEICQKINNIHIYSLYLIIYFQIDDKINILNSITI